MKELVDNIEDFRLHLIECLKGHEKRHEMAAAVLKKHEQRIEKLEKDQKKKKGDELLKEYIYKCNCGRCMLTLELEEQPSQIPCVHCAYCKSCICDGEQVSP